MTKNPRIQQRIPVPVDDMPVDSRFDKEELDVPGETGPPTETEDTGPPTDDFEDVPTLSRAETFRMRPPFAVRAGDILQIADTTRLALVVAETATDLLDQRGDMPKTVASLRMQIAALRGL